MKNSVIFIVIALSLFALFLSVAAQTELPAIDEAEAAPFLGRWYMNSACGADDTCVNMADIGITIIYDLNADNTIEIRSGDEAASNMSWYMEKGNAYSVVPLTETTTQLNELMIDENGMLYSMNDEGYVIFTREEPTVSYSETVAADAVTADFAGEWHVKGMIFEGDLIPAQMFGSDILLTIDGEKFVLTDGLAVEEAPYITEEGRLSAVLEGTDDAGQPTEENVLIELHDDGNLFLFFDPGTENESSFVFTREKNVFDNQDISEAMGLDAIGENVSGLVDGLTNEDGSFNFSGLVQQLTGKDNFDLNGLMQQITGNEEFDISSLMSGVTSDEQGGFDLSGLLDGLTSGNSEGGFNLGGLMDMFGHGN